MLRRPLLNLCVALWLLVLLNLPFWRRLWEAVGGWDSSRAGFLLSLPVFLLVCVWLLLECMTWGRAGKPVLAVLLVVSATVSYFMHVYGIAFDRSMVSSVLETDPAEATELVSLSLIAWLALLALLPAWLVAQARLPPLSWRGQLLGKGMTLGVLLSALAVIIAPFFQSYAALLRNHRDLRFYLVPSNYLAAAHSYARARLRTDERLEQVGRDAIRVGYPARKPVLVLVVIGETARAANFGLNGYARDTTPNLAAEPDLVAFRDVRSCGTSTAVSLPCMFLDAGRAGFAESLALRRESLLDVLQRTGANVLWRENNSGCKGVCDRVPHEDVSHATVPASCGGSECHDEILLHGLQEKVEAMQGDTVVVLHMKGSHGPAYYLRYPAAFEHFTPVCRTNQFDKCEREAVINAYDNTLRYTDHVLARAIALLKQNAERFDTSLIYVSDHGESLGERGIYLHGLPYAIAPKEQTHVPMFIWLGPGSAQQQRLECLRGKQNIPLSHDNLYHSVLGLLEVQTSVYRPDLDILHSCRNGRGNWTEAQAPVVAR